MIPCFDPDAYFPPYSPPERSVKRPRTPSSEVSTLASQTLNTKRARVEDPIFTTVLEAQIGNIETCLKKRGELHLSAAAKPLVDHIANHDVWTQERKCVELGVLCYYIASRRSLPSGEPMRALLMEMKEYLVFLKNRKACITYILRQFAKLIITAHGDFNLGGCYAVRSFLASSLHNWIDEDLKKQIEAIIDQLTSDTSIQELFQNPIIPCPTFHEWLRADMGLDSEDAITTAHVWQDVIIALCLRPEEEAQEERLACVQLLLSALKDGIFCFENMYVPIEPLWNVCHKNVVEPNFLSQFGEALTRFTQLNSTCLNSEKSLFCTPLKKKIEKFTKHLCTQEEFKELSNYLNWFCDQLFLVEDSSVKRTIKNFNVVFEGHTSHFPFSGNWDDFAVFSRLNRLFILREGKLIALDTFTALEAHFTAGFDRNIEDKGLIEGLKSYFHSDQFKNDLAEAICIFNKGKSNFDSNWFFVNNALLLINSIEI